MLTPQQYYEQQKKWQRQELRLAFLLAVFVAAYFGLGLASAVMSWM